MKLKDKVLVVEDEQNISNFISTVLTANDFDVLVAQTGAEAVSMITSHCPDLIILDLGLPDMDGMNILKEVRSWSSLPIIVVSARTHEHDKVMALDLGADDYLPKPATVPMILRALGETDEEGGEDHEDVVQVEQQEGRKKEFRKTLRVNPSRITITSIDEQLIQKALKLIEEHIDNSEYNVEHLSADMGMSRMNLYRKLQAITDRLRRNLSVPFV